MTPPDAVAAMRRRTASLRASSDSDCGEDGPMLTRCAWCERIALGEVWLEREEFQRQRTPSTRFRLTHGICPDCLAGVKAGRVARHPSR